MTKKEQIHQAAAKLFQEKGYQAASMRDLAKAVGLQVSSLYSHLGKKEEVLQKMCFDNAHRFVQQIAIDNPTSITVFNDEWKHLSEPFLTDFLELRKQYESQFKGIIKAGIAAQEFQQVQPTIAFYTILTSLRWVHYWYDSNKGITKEALEADIVRLLCGGLKN